MDDNPEPIDYSGLMEFDPSKFTPRPDSIDDPVAMARDQAIVLATWPGAKLIDYRTTNTWEKCIWPPCFIVVDRAVAGNGRTPGEAWQSAKMRSEDYGLVPKGEMVNYVSK